MKELKFTPENLQRHLNSRPYKNASTVNMFGRRIFTTLDEKKGDIGTVFTIEGIGKFVLIKIIPFNPRNDDVEFLWLYEGFSSEKEFLKEMKRLYGNKPKVCFVHELLELIEE